MDLLDKIRSFSAAERSFVLMPVVLVVLGGAVGAVLGIAAICLNLLVFRSSALRPAKFAASLIIFGITIAFYFASVRALQQAISVETREWVGASVLILGALLIPFVFVRGLLRGKVLDPLGFFAIEASLRNAPYRYYIAMAFWGLLLAAVLWLAFALAFLSA